MNASELMFFYGAPLAHVVQYESHLREVRHTKTIKDLVRARRAYSFVREMGGPAMEAVK